MKRLGLLALPLLLSACTAAQQQAEAGPDVQALIDQAPPEQRTALADASVSRAEYDEAARAYETCLRDQGWPDASIEWDEPARQGLAGSWSTVVPGLTDTTTPQFESTMDRCGDRYLYPLGRIFSIQHTDQRVLDEHLTEVQEKNGEVTVTDESES